jgi:hypothetical protein
MKINQFKLPVNQIRRYFVDEKGREQKATRELIENKILSGWNGNIFFRRINVNE